MRATAVLSRSPDERIWPSIPTAKEADMRYEEMARKILRENGYDDWFVVNEAVLTCPHGHDIEYDGTCPEGCVSPIREMGLI